jgi:exonuclease VII small subunit
MYYCENYSTIEKIVSELDSNESSSIKFVKELFSSDLSGKLAYIKSYFVLVSKTIACLEAFGVETNDALDTVKSAERALEQARGKVAQNVKNRFKKVLERNYGFSIMCKINGNLGGNGATLGEEDLVLDSNDVTLFKYAPLISCDIERSISQYKTILSVNDRSVSFENLKMHLVIHCNVARHED